MHIRNIFVVFLVTGLWHGASWNFVLWGTIHGFYMIMAILIAAYVKPLLKMFSFHKPYASLITAFSIMITFFLTCFAWIFFRAETLSDALYIVTHLTTGLKGLVQLLLQGNLSGFAFLAFDQHRGVGLPLPQLGIVSGVIIFMILLEILFIRNKFIMLPRWTRWTIYIILVMFILNLGPATQAPFIYFQF